MKKNYLKLLVTVVALFVTSVVFAQDEEITPTSKPTVFFEKSANHYESDQKKSVRNAIMTAMTQTQRIIIIDAESESISHNEDLRRTASDVTAGEDMVPERLGAIVRLGAQYYIKTNVDDIVYTRESSDDRTTVTCTITITLKLIDPTTSTVKATEQMKFSGSNSNNEDGKAFDQAKSDMFSTATMLTRNPLLAFVDTYFPVVCQIIDLEESKKEKAVSVYINAGSDNGIVKGNKFEVFKDKKVGSRVAQIVIGELEAKDVQAGDLTLCKVTKNGEEIFRAFNEGTILRVKTRPKKKGLLDRF